MNWMYLQELLTAPDVERRVTFEPPLNHAQWCADVVRLAGAIQATGAGRVALYDQDAGAFATGLFAAWLAGASVLLPADLRPETRLRWTGEVDLWLTEEDPAPPAAEPLPLACLDLNRLCLSVCTSGSSGEPKRIDKTLRQLANEVDALECLWGVDLGSATLIASVASQHIYGLLFRILWPLCAGRPFLRRQLPFAEDLQRASREQQSFAWVASPALLKRMGDNLDWPALSTVKMVFSSGGALPADAAEALERRLGQRPTEILGSSETGGIAWRQMDDRWQPFADVQLSLGEGGALQVTSPYLPAGHTEITQDAAQIDEDGRFRLLGRLDRIVKLEEKRISLALLENVLSAHPWVADARLGVVQGNRASLGALVVLSNEGAQALRQGGRKALTERLRAALAEHCEALALPRRWRLLQQLPLNSQGKLPQATIEALLQAPRPNEPQILAHERVGEDWQVSLRVPLDLACFSGHFPTAPVLPGVIQVGWALQQARERMTLPPRFAGMEVLKFQQLVRPGDLLNLTLRFDAERGKLYFTFRAGEQSCSSGRILLEPAHA